MKDQQKLIDILQNMQNSIVQNYVIAGLRSSLVGGGNFGRVRLFEASRFQQDSISPHSHRFDFACMVLRGTVINRIWHECNEQQGDFFEESVLVYQGEIGHHSKRVYGRNFYGHTLHLYSEGQCYSMSHNQIHSIEFSRDAIVLFFEGPQLSSQSVVLEPVVDGKVIPTYERRDYMFRKVTQELA